MSVGNFRFFALSYSLALTKGCLKKSSFGTFYWIAIIFSSFLYTSGPRTILEMEVSVGGFLISFSTRGLENEVLGTILWNFVLVQILLLSCFFVWAEILRKVKRGSNFSQFKVESRSAWGWKSKRTKKWLLPRPSNRHCVWDGSHVSNSLPACWLYFYFCRGCVWRNMVGEGEYWTHGNGLSSSTSLSGWCGISWQPGYYFLLPPFIQSCCIEFFPPALEFLLLLLIHISSQNYASYFLAERMLHRRLRKSTKKHYKGWLYKVCSAIWHV